MSPADPNRSFARSAIRVADSQQLPENAPAGGLMRLPLQRLKFLLETFHSFGGVALCIAIHYSSAVTSDGQITSAVEQRQKRAVDT